jgi:hypothetical protein
VSYFPGMRDTSTEAIAVVRATIRAIDPVDRLRAALAHSEAMRDLALARLRVRYPNRSTLELVELLLGQPLISKDHTSETP